MSTKSNQNLEQLEKILRIRITLALKKMHLNSQLYTKSSNSRNKEDENDDEDDEGIPPNLPHRIYNGDDIEQNTEEREMQNGKSPDNQKTNYAIDSPNSINKSYIDRSLPISPDQDELIIQNDEEQNDNQAKVSQFDAKNLQIKDKTNLINNQNDMGRNLKEYQPSQKFMEVLKNTISNDIMSKRGTYTNRSIQNQDDQISEQDLNHEVQSQNAINQFQNIRFSSYGIQEVLHKNQNYAMHYQREVESKSDKQAQQTNLKSSSCFREQQNKKKVVLKGQLDAHLSERSQSTNNNIKEEQGLQEKFEKIINNDHLKLIDQDIQQLEESLMQLNKRKQCIDKNMGELQRISKEKKMVLENSGIFQKENSIFNRTQILQKFPNASMASTNSICPKLQNQMQNSNVLALETDISRIIPRKSPQRGQIDKVESTLNLTNDLLSGQKSHKKTTNSCINDMNSFEKKSPNKNIFSISPQSQAKNLKQSQPEQKNNNIVSNEQNYISLNNDCFTNNFIENNHGISDNLELKCHLTSPLLTLNLDILNQNIQINIFNGQNSDQIAEQIYKQLKIPLPKAITQQKLSDILQSNINLFISKLMNQKNRLESQQGNLFELTFHIMEKLTQYSSLPSEDRLNGRAKSLIQFLKAGIGTGLLVTPFIFSQCGLILTPIILLICGILSFLAICMTIDVLENTDPFDTKLKIFDASRILLGEKKTHVLTLANILFCFGTASNYILLIMKNIMLFFNFKESILAKIIIGLVLAVIYIPLTKFRNLAYITKYSSIAVSTQIVIFCFITINSLSVLYYNGIRQEAIHNIFNIMEIPKYFGIMFFMYDFCPVFSDVRNSMRDPKGDCKKIAFIYYISLYILSLFVGGTTYLAFGQATDEIVFKNIEEKGIISNYSGIINLVYVLCLIISLTFFNFTLYSLVEKCTDIRENEKDKQFYMRIIVYGLECVVAVFAPSLSFILNLIGSVFLTVILFIYPYLCIKKLYYEHSWLGEKGAIHQLLFYVGICIGALGLLAQFM